ncbi:C6 transcription factor [Paramyrothecium foliicola]|nr:C6 transcription factor [Paramyrothecium foliicola]
MKSDRRKRQAAREEPRSRTFTGCRTCRSRHLKCDEARPSCSTCRRLKLKCEGYAPRLLWVAKDAEDEPDAKERGSSYRYPLFTEDSRNSMSLEIVQSLGSQSAGTALTDLDSESVSDDTYHSAGPFGVFRAFDEQQIAYPSRVAPAPAPKAVGDLNTPQLSPRFPDLNVIEELPDATVDKELNSHLDDPSIFWQDELVEPSQNMVPYTDWSIDRTSAAFAADLAFEVEDWMQIGARAGGQSPFSLSVDGFGLNLVLTPRSGTPRSGNPRSGTPRGQVMDFGSAVEVNSSKSDQQESMKKKRDTSTSSKTQVHLEKTPRHVHTPVHVEEGNALPLHAASLLRYLKAEILEKSPTKISSRLSPWKALFLPCALETFAEISLWNTTSYTRQSILCTLLAKSAYHLHKSTAKDPLAASQWYDVAVSHHTAAQEHLMAALDSEFHGENQAKYTEMLMAMLGAGIVSVHFGGPTAMKKLLLDAEKYIRLRGLPSNKSFGLRVLHHMYTHLRVIVESTSSVPLSMHDEASLGQLEKGASSAESAITLRGFGVNESNLGDLDPLRDKPEDIGYNDIHLDVSGQWSMTLYPEMYGIPESLMTLLSQTISLANEKPKLEVAGLSNHAVSLALAHHTKALEQQIWSWSMESSKIPVGPERPSALTSADTPPFDRLDARPMILAIHQALIIYFYRRVYNMSAMIVQDQVQKTLDYLQPHLDILKYDQDYAISVGWALFVAVCEANTTELQNRGLECLESMNGCGVFVETDQPSTIAKSVWERRKRTGDLTLSWPDVMLQVAM